MMDSLTADQTRRRLEPSAACVKLVKLPTLEFIVGCKREEWNALRVYTQSGTVGLYEFQQYVLCRFIGVGTTDVVRKMPL